MGKLLLHFVLVSLPAGLLLVKACNNNFAQRSVSSGQLTSERGGMTSGVSCPPTSSLTSIAPTASVKYSHPQAILKFHHPSSLHDRASHGLPDIIFTLQ